LQQAVLEDVQEYRVATKFAARKLIGESTGTAIGLTGCIEQRARHLPIIDVYSPSPAIPKFYISSDAAAGQG
jgi:hypothetical protein